MRDIEKKLVLTEVVNHLAVHGVHAFTRDVAFQVIAAINNGEPVGLCILKHTHDLGHGRGIVQDSGRFNHQLRGAEMMVELSAEHDVTYLNDVYFA